MEQLTRIFNNLSLMQKLSLLVAIAAVGLGLSWASRWNKERDLRPIFTNLSPEDAGAVVEKLKAANIEYKVSDTGRAILVPSDRVAELRIEMAAAGLPKTGRLGFELFDKTNFGATEFAEQVNFRRALEGELERSVMGLGEVERARVHVTFAKESVFVQSRQPAKASVLVKLRPGRQLTPQNVMAITHLTASAVEGLSPESVSVLDMEGNLLNRLRRPSADGSSAYSDEMIEYRQAVEKDLLAKVSSTLDTLLGPEKYRVGVSADCDFSSGELSEETFDPEKSVMTASQKSEDATGSAGSAGVPGTASNLPRPVVKAGGAGSSASRRTENITFQTSRVVKHTKIPQGQVKRLSISVLVDNTLRWDGVGPKAKRVLEPPTPEKLKIVKDVVAGIVGFQQDRGDQLLVETLPFDATLNVAPPEAPEAPKVATPMALPFPVPAWAKPVVDKLGLPVLLGIAGFLLLLILAVPVIFVMKKKKKAGKAALALQHALPADPAHPHAAMDEGQRQVQGANASGNMPQLKDSADFEKKAMAEIANANHQREAEENSILAGLRLQPPTKKSEVLKRHIVEEAKKDPEAVAQLLRTWLNEERPRQ